MKKKWSLKQLLLTSFSNLSSSYDIGMIAEGDAVSYLKSLSYKILHLRFKHFVKVKGAGEIDIIAKDSVNKQIVFIEVKSRKYHEDFDEIVSLKQQKRIAMSAVLFMKSSDKYKNYGIRFDVVFIHDGNLNHIKNAFQCDSFEIYD